MNKDNVNTSIGGMASSHLPDSTSESPTAAQLTSNAPLMSVLRHDNSVPGPTLQFESAAGLLDDLEDSDDDAPRSGEKRSGRRKIKIEYIEDKSRRHITFSKRKAGIMKKAYELSTLTGTQVLLLVASETGHVYTFATPKLQPLITKQEGKNLIQACLNSPDHHSAIPEYLPSVQSTANSVAHYENDIAEEDLAPRSNSIVGSSSSSGAHGYLPTGTTPTPPAGSSAAAVAAAAAQVFMNSGQPSHYVGYAQQASSGAYWNGGNPPAGGMYAPIPAKSNQSSQQQLQQLQQSQQSQQQQQQQQQQMYHALMQQQQLLQQYNQHQNQPHHHKSHESPDS